VRCIHPCRWLLNLHYNYRKRHPSPLVSHIRCHVPGSTYFPHKGIGVVIGMGVVLGERIHIFPHVMIGLRDYKTKGYPVIEDDVVIYTGAVVAGPIRVGRGAVIGANTVVLRDVSPGEVVHC